MQYLRGLSGRTEFVLIIAVAFGYFILGSILSLLAPAAGPAISEYGLQFLIVYEAVVLGLLAAFLAARGWNREQLGLTFTSTDIAAAVLLWVVGYGAHLAMWYAIGQHLPGQARMPDGIVEPNLRLGTVVISAMVNGTFEEVFVCGYTIAALRKSRSAAFAINVSIVIRLSYHLYQGSAGVIGIVPLGLVFSHWFARTNRLWPVILAHCLFDIVGLWPYVIH